MIAQFSLRLLLGLAFAWAVLPRPQITSGFFRIQSLLALALAVLAAVTAGDLVAPSAARNESSVAEATATDAPAGSAGLPAGDGAQHVRLSVPALSPAVAAGLCAALAACAFAGSVAWTLERRAGGTMFLRAILLGTAGLLAGSAVAGRALSPLEILHRVLSEFAAAGVLGGCVAGMLLGHWYLTAPTMSIAPLGRANLWFGVTLLFRSAMSAVGLGVARGLLFGATRGAENVHNMTSQAAGFGTTHFVWLALRWIAGIALPSILCVMTAKILKYRNTQSATGVLFAAVILVFLGELAGVLLSREIGLPL